MKAVVVEKYKQPLRVADVQEPTVGDADVLIQVAATSLNQLDEKVRSAEFRPLLRYRAPFVLGHDVAGTVVEVGARVTQFSAGDRVYARPADGRIGTFAERISVPAEDVALQPRGISPEEAASLPLVALTAWQALVVIGRVKPGDKVLIQAGSGGVGTLAIQLAKHLGATVATTVSQPNAELVRDLGADIVVDYRTERFDELLSSYDVVLDSLGPDSVLRSLSIVKPGGTVISISGPPDPAFAREHGLNLLLRLVMAVASRKVRARAAKLGVTYRFLLMSANGRQLAEVTKLVDAGVLRPVVGKVIELDDVPKALSFVGKDGTAGKTVARVA